MVRTVAAQRRQRGNVAKSRLSRLRDKMTTPHSQMLVTVTTQHSGTRVKTSTPRCPSMIVTTTPPSGERVTLEQKTNKAPVREMKGTYKSYTLFGTDCCIAQVYNVYSVTLCEGFIFYFVTLLSVITQCISVSKVNLYEITYIYIICSKIILEIL